MAELEKFGRDIRLDRHGDVIFTSDGDVEAATGGHLVAQDIRTEVILSPGACFWAPTFGQGLGEALKGPDTFDVETALRAAAFNDERVSYDSVSTKRLPNGHYLLSFVLFDGTTPLELFFDLKENLGDLD